MGCSGQERELNKTKTPNLKNNANNIPTNNRPKNNNIPTDNNSFKNKPQVNINNNNMTNMSKEHMKNIQIKVKDMTIKENTMYMGMSKNMCHQGRAEVKNSYQTINKGGDIDTTNFNENDYPIFESNWTETNLQNIRFITLDVVNKVILYEKLFITINLDKGIAKVVNIYKEELGNNKKSV